MSPYPEPTKEILASSLKSTIERCHSLGVRVICVNNENAFVSDHGEHYGKVVYSVAGQMHRSEIISLAYRVNYTLANK
jgi:hypothetical protein